MDMESVQNIKKNDGKKTHRKEEKGVPRKESKQIEQIKSQNAPQHPSPTNHTAACQTP